jgi:hypothetical protein
MGSDMLKLLAGIILLCLSSISLTSLAQEPITASEYLGLNESRREVIFQRQLRAQEGQFATCLREIPRDQLQKTVEGWLATNPQFMNRTLSLAMTFALEDVCADAAE